MKYQIVCDDVLHWAAEYEGPPFHAILTDPPYHLHSGSNSKGGFMNATWDGGHNIAFQSSTWAALAEHLSPGGFIMAFGGARTFHRLACAMEDAGLVLNSALFLWAQGSGFPKSANIHIQLEKRLCYKKGNDWYYRDNDESMRTEPPFRHPDADKFYGHRYGTQCLKPAVEPIIVAQKPWTNKRLDCIVETGAGALNIGKARIGTGGQGGGAKMSSSGHTLGNFDHYEGDGFKASPRGRWPSNFVLAHVPPDESGGGGCRRVGVKRVNLAILSAKKQVGDCQAVVTGKNGHISTQVTKPGHADPDGLETIDDFQCVENCPVARLDAQAGERKSGKRHPSKNSMFVGTGGISDSGDASRFFQQADWSHEVAEQIAGADPVHYCPKAAKKERTRGLDDFYWRIDKSAPIGFVRIDKALGQEEEQAGKHMRLRAPQGNIHSTVKPISLDVWLCRLLSPPGEYAPRRLLIPFLGSGSEMAAAVISGCWEEIVGVEINQDYCDIAESRVEFWLNRPLDHA